MQCVYCYTVKYSIIIYVQYMLYSEIALEIINSDHWEKAMRMCNDSNITPMRLLIKFMPGIYMHIY